MRRIEMELHGLRRASLGHLFPHGPGATGKRHCINSCSLELDEH